MVGETSVQDLERWPLSNSIKRHNANAFSVQRISDKDDKECIDGLITNSSLYLATSYSNIHGFRIRHRYKVSKLLFIGGSDNRHRRAQFHGETAFTSISPPHSQHHSLMDVVDDYLIQPAISAVFNLVIQQIVSEPVQRFLNGRKTTSDLLGQLKQATLALNAVVADAEQKTITNEPVKLWLDELKDAMYDVETLLDEIATRALQSAAEGPHTTPESSSIKKVLYSISTFLRQPDHEKVDSIISDMCKRLDVFLQQISILGLQVNPTGKHLSRGKKPATTSLLDQSMRYVGRDSDLEGVVRFLQYEQLTVADQTGEQSQKRTKIESHNYDIRIIAIVGMPGVGKTTLAQLLYNDGRLDDLFDLKAWLHLPRDFTNALVFKTIYELLCEEPLRSDNLELIQKKLCKMIGGKRLLLVFDDVWIEHFQSWDELIRPMKTAGRGTTIIVTTQNANIATWMHANCTIFLKPLSDEDCWSVIRSVALDSRLNSHGNLEVIGRQIAMKCRGLPLAAAVLGGALHSMPEEADKWDVVLRSPIWEIPDAIYGILPALRLSYDYLPHPQIKRCFAYCSLYPKNYRFQKEELVLLWMAEGFIAPSQSHTTMEQIGSSYFDELMSRSFFQELGSSTIFFVMHDLLHDLAVNVLGRFGLMWNSNYQFNLRRARHFSFQQTKYHDSEKFRVLADHSLWTLLALGCGSPCYLRTFFPISEPPTCTSLRVLSMPHYQVTQITPSIGSLKHLRYLNFSSTTITSLPESISVLYNLQTLLLSNCYNLQSLPIKLGFMVSLRHLNISNTKMLQVMPPQIGRLTNLQSLSKFVVGSYSGQSIAELNQLNSLRGILLVSRLENVVSDSDAAASNMSEKIHLEELVYEWSATSRNQYHVLEKLKPHINLKRLTIKGFGDERFPGWVGAAEYCNVVVLHLKDCFTCISLPPLGQLPSLKHLFIIGFMLVREVGHDFYGNNGSSSFTPFPSLEILKFECMPLWYSWSTFEGDGPAFPQLQELCLIYCKKLCIVLPLNIPSVRKLAIVDCGIGDSLQLPSSLDSLELSSWHDRHKALSALLKSVSPRTLKIGRSNMMLATSFVINETGEPILISPSVQELEISNCVFKPICRLPPWLRSLTMHEGENLELEEQCYASLQYLSISGASSIQSFRFDHFPNLISLDFSACFKLSSFLAPPGYIVESLCNLHIRDCSSLLEFPPGGLPAPNLTTFTINGCNRLKSLPERMHYSMPSLKCLSITSCPEIGSLPFGGLPSDLRTLKIHQCYKLMPLQENWQLSRVSSLEKLEIEEGIYDATCESFPNSEALLPTSLTSLSIRDLRTIKFLNGKAFQHLTSLQELKISECRLLKCLPEDGFPQSLCSLEIHACPLLKLRCQKTGEYWPKISHLPHINNHGEEI